MAVKSTRVAWARPRWAALAVAAVACLRCGGSSKDNSDANGGKPSASGGVNAGGNAGAAGSSLAEGAKSGSAATGSGGAGGANVGGANSATGGRLGSSGSGGSAGVAGQPAAGGAAGHAGTNGANGGAGASSGAGASGSSAGGNASAGSEGKGGSAGSAGTGGMSGLEYRACEPGGSVTRITVYRIDAAAQTCTEVVVQQGAGGCTLGLISGGYCLSRANVSKDVTACQMLMPATGGVDATSVTGTFSVSSGASFVVGLDVTFQFPSSAGLPTTVQTQINGCAADCLLNDCRT